MTATADARMAERVAVPSQPDSPLALGAVLLAVLGLSVGSTMVKSTGLPGPVTGFWRLLFGAIGWQVLIGAQRRRFTLAALKRTMVPGLLFGTNLAFFFTGVTKTAIAHAEFMGVLTPIMLVPLAAFRLRERIKRSVLALGALAITGVVTIVVFSAHKGGKATLTGDLFVLCGVLLWAGYLLQAKKIRVDMDTDSFMAGMTAWAFVAVTPFALATHRLTTVSTKGWILLVTMALTSGIIGHGLLSYAQRHVPLTVITLLQLGQPPLGVLWGFIFLHETVRPMQIVGMALVLSAVGGVALTTAKAQQQQIQARAAAAS